jgi:hypothetical protein
MLTITLFRRRCFVAELNFQASKFSQQVVNLTLKHLISKDAESLVKSSGILTV